MKKDNVKATETQQTPNRVEECIKEYLERRAKRDKAFAEMYANPNKSIPECVQYIKECAKEQAVNGAAFCEDEEVFGWAVHYYNEPDLKPKNNVQASVGVSSGDKKQPAKKTAEDDLADEIDGMLD